MSGSAIAPQTDTAALDQNKTKLEIENLLIDLDEKRRLRKFSTILQILPSVSVIVAVAGLWFSLSQYRAEQNKHQDDLKKHQAELIESAQREFMKPLLEKQQALYIEASSAAATIASTSDKTDRKKAEDSFWRLYWGPMVMVESEEVSGAMKHFGNCLNGAKCGDLKEESLVLASTLEEDMLKRWNEKPEQFTAKQFKYRN